MIISNDESSHETIWSILKDSISTSQLVLGLYLTFYLFWPTKTRKSPTSKGCNLRRDPQHATGPTCWYRKTVAHDVRKSKESPHPVLSCDEKNYVIYIYTKIFRTNASNCRLILRSKWSWGWVIIIYLFIMLPGKSLPPTTSWFVTFGSRGICTWFKETLGDRQPPPAPDMLEKMVSKLKLSNSRTED